MDGPEKIYFLEENDAFNFFIGRNAGGKLKTSIRDAQKSIRVISPYINESTIETLGKKKETGLSDIKLITCVKEKDLSDKWQRNALDRLIHYQKDGGKDVYKPIFDVVFFKGKKDSFVHEKLYLVDDAAYTGSVNFTDKGLDDNHETCLLFKQPAIVQKLYDYFDKLAASKMETWDIAELGKQIHTAKKTGHFKN